MLQLNNIENQIPRGVGYYRYSTDMQNETSIEGQRRFVKEFATKNHIHLIDEYTDRAKSGGTDKREFFQQMVNDIRTGKIAVNYILVYKLDRLFRNEKLHRRYEDELEKHNVKIISVTEEQVNDTTLGSKIVKSILVLMNEHEREKISQNVTRGLKETAYKGKWCGGTPPLGYNVNKESQKLVLNETEVKAVKLAFQLRGQGLSYSYICDKLNSLGYKTKHGNKFGKNSLFELFRNKKYKGVLEYNKSASKSADGTFNRHASKSDDEIITIKGGCPRIVSAKLWNKVNNMGKKGGEMKPKGDYLLSGLVVCKCGAFMQVNRRTNHQKEYLSFFCPKHKNKEGCDAKEINLTLLENFIMKILSDKIFSKHYINEFWAQYNELDKERIKKNTKTIRRLKSELRNNKTKIKNLITRLENGCSDTVANALEEKIEELDTANKKLKRKIKKLQKQEETIPSEDDILELKTRFSEYMQSKVNLPIRKKLLSELVEKIVVSDDKVEVILNI